MKFKLGQEVVCTNDRWRCVFGHAPAGGVPHPVKDDLYIVKSQSPAKTNFIELQEFPRNYWDEREFEPVVPNEQIAELLEYVSDSVKV